ncbi:MAG: hypothetical protein R3F59_19680 [Myxococcota bacterium]
MKTISDRLLRQYLAGALEPPAQERIERALRDVDGLRERMAALLATSLPEPRASWVIPPPGAPRGLTATAEPAAFMGEPEAGWTVLWLDVDDAQLDARPVVLERAGADWEVVFPLTEDEVVPLRALHREGGRTRLDVDTSRARRVAVVLVPSDRPLDLTLPDPERWAAVIASVQAGELPVVALAVPPEAR